ncbi:MAG TPA: PDZ domain-containing protein [Verrucomicrobiae bacterium]|jgi:tricorn protease|nr:PDZ domain-containing protein [Verrucomicrobiae bacterium]
MDQGYYRHPTISGDRIVFVCEDDLWSVNAGGGDATRLTVSFGTCATPRLSPDGRLVAFVSTDEGNPEVYVMPADGGRPERLTFMGATIVAVSGWSADGREILFTANPRAWFGGETQPFSIAPDGGTPRNLQLGHARSVARGTGGAIVLGRNAEDPARWKRYRGGTSGEIWIDPSGSGEFQRVALPDGNPVGPMLIDERLFFLADHEGIGNIYSSRLDGSDVRRQTHENDYYVRFPSTDGTRVAYSAGGTISVYDVASDSTRALQIATRSAAPQTARRFEHGDDGLEHIAVHPDGSSCALIARGQPFTLPFFEGATIHYGIGSRARYRLAEWLHDGKRFACVTDLNGYEQLATFADGGGDPTLVTTGDIGRVTDLAASPTGETIAFANHRCELCVVDLEDGRVRVLDASPAHRIEDLAFSPDGRFIAYSWSPMNGASILRVVKVKSGKVHDVTSLLRVDRSPAWDPQGKYLYFLSARDFNPVYDALQFDLSFPLAERPFAITLRNDVPSPFVPKQRPLHRDHDHDHHHHHDRDRNENSDEKSAKPVRVEIDFDGIQGRVLGFPVDEANYGRLVAGKERVLFTRFEVKGIKPAGHTWDEETESGVLLAYDFDQQRLGTMAIDVGEIRLGNDARTLLYTSQERLRAIDVEGDLPEDDDEPKLSTEPGRKSGFIDLARVNVEIAPRDEWAQMYREAWRLQTEQFWVADMSDIDWDRVYDRYDAVLPRVRTRTELSDVIWEMQGELGTSHAYEFGGDHRVPPQYQRGFLGADLAWDDAADGYRIERIYRGDSWNRETDSPLAEPGLDLRVGDVIVAIGGRHLTRALTPDRLLVNTSGRDVAVTVERKDQKARTVLVRALASESPLRYRAWVEENRRIVHERTNGAVGYLHVPDMGPWGFSEFHRGYLNEFDRRGLIVDVRFNRGGHVSPLLLEKLARKRVGYDVPRYGRPVPYPPESVAGPIVAMTNQFAGSDGDIFSHCFKLYKLGPLVGKRTWGGVIGIDPYHRLVDGTITTQPEFSFWFSDVGWKVENYGTDPDYDVDVAPHDYRDGNDPQLELALRLMDGALANAQPFEPDLTTRPSLPLPSLQ